MEERMTVCNMSIEAGARAGMVARRPEDRRLSARPAATLPQGAEFDRRAEAAGLTLRTDAGAKFDRSIVLRRRRLRAAGHLGHQSRRWSPKLPARFPIRRAFNRCRLSAARLERALEYMGLAARHADRGYRDRPGLYRLVHQLAPDRSAGRRRRSSRAARSPADVHAMVVPGSQAGQSRSGDSWAWTASSREAGFEWREAGCSMCLGMNPDILKPGERCASTSQPQLRRAPGQGRPHASGEPADGGRRGRRRPFRRHARTGPNSLGQRERQSRHRHATHSRISLASSRRSTAQRRHRPDNPQAVSEGGRPQRARQGPVLRLAPTCRRLDRSGFRARTIRAIKALRSWWRGPISAAAARASTRCGRWPISAFAP